MHVTQIPLQECSVSSQSLSVSSHLILYPSSLSYIVSFLLVLGGWVPPSAGRLGISRHFRGAGGRGGQGVAESQCPPLEICLTEKPDFNSSAGLCLPGSSH